MVVAAMDSELATLRAVIVASYPELHSACFDLHTVGWDSFAVDVDDRLIFKFPRHAEAEMRLKAEAGLLAALRSKVTMSLPDQQLHPGPPLFSCHAKLKGEHLLAPHYARLSIRAREQLAADVALFFAELHALDHTAMKAAGAGPIGSWLPPDEILRQAWPLLPPDLHDYAERTIKAWQDLGPDPHGTVYGHFDSHGWNMAFDRDAERLTGIYDFGDSGFGDLHKEFVPPSWISPDFVERLAKDYEQLTGRAIDLQRGTLTCGVLRLSELGGFANDPVRAEAMVKSVADWAAYQKHRFA
jgi:aminoglycoside phosphotransferase (APT) family kinase protein